MSWSIAAIRDGLATRLQTISGLYVHKRAVGGITPPAALILLGSGSFLSYDTSTGSDDLALSLRLFVSRADDAAGQDTLDSYLERDSDNSIYAAVATDPTLGGACDYAVVTGASDYGTATVGTVDYFGCDFTVEVAVS